MDNFDILIGGKLKRLDETGMEVVLNDGRELYFKFICDNGD